MNTRTREQIIAIADAIRTLGYDQSEARQHNVRGWTIDVRYKGQEYVGPNNYTRTSDLHLSDEELDVAFRLAATEPIEWESFLKEVKL